MVCVNVFVFCFAVYDYNCAALCFNGLVLPFALLGFMQGSPQNETQAVGEMLKYTISSFATSIPYGSVARKDTLYLK